ncbi:thioredoxin domain-containing protein [Ancylomarina longa]|nr:thioredoxin domain-containing protein [Ancylomarina longa]
MHKAITLFIPILLFFSACGQKEGINQLDALEFEKQIQKEQAILLDVRTLNEYKNGHIQNAGQLNYYALNFKRKLLLLPKDQPIYLYCNTGYRSNRAARILKDNAYLQVFNLEHGIMEWNLKNLNVEKSPDAKPDLDHQMKKEAFERWIESDSLVFIDFYAPWCGPCRKMMPMIDSLKVNYHKKLKILKINSDASKQLMKELKMNSVPYLVLYRRGEILFSHKGSITKRELIDIFEKHLSPNSK